jgi:hypothetical protein
LCLDRNWKGINIYQNGTFRLIDTTRLEDCDFTASQITDNQLWLGTKKGFYTVDLDKLLKEQITVSTIDIVSKNGQYCMTNLI